MSILRLPSVKPPSEVGPTAEPRAAAINEESIAELGQDVPMQELELLATSDGR